MKTEMLFEEARKLSPQGRMALARAMIDSVAEEAQDADFILTPELEQELDSIVKEMDEHPELCVPFDQVEKELDQLLEKDRLARK